MSFRAVTSRLLPNKQQQKVLEETRLICTRLWNHLKDECIATYMESGRAMSVYDLNAGMVILTAGVATRPFAR